MWEEIAGPAGNDGVARMGFKGRPISIHIKGIILILFNKAACIIIVQFTSCVRAGGPSGARAVREREGGR